MTEAIVANLQTADLAYHDVGEGKPVLLVHGFASTARVNWLNTSWSKALNEAGYRVIAFDNRGHGASQKFYTPEDYGPDIFATDAFALMDHLEIDRCPVIGYSMGARITSWMCAHGPERVSTAVFGGMGANIINSSSNFISVAEALETEDPATIKDTRSAMFRSFADRVGADRLALAACIRPSKAKITEEMIASIKTPVLVAVGDEDEVGGSAETLAAKMQNATAFVMLGLDHMKSTGAKAFKERTIEFLKEYESEC